MSDIVNELHQKPSEMSIFCSEEPLTNAERLEIYRQARWEQVVEYALENERVRPVLWEWLRLTWGNASPIGKQAE